MEIINYIKESYKELTQEMTWISLEEAQKQTILVVIFTVVFSVAVFIADKTIQSMLDNLYRLFV